MRNAPQTFDQRQEMLRSDFEVAYKVDTNLREVGLHHHDFYEIDFLLSGNVTYAIESRVYRVMPGDVLVISPKELHQVFIDPNVEPYERYTLWITPSLLARLSTEKTDLARCFDTGRQGYGNLIRLKRFQRNIMHTLMDEILQEMDTAEYGSDIFRDALLVHLMVFINRIVNSNVEQPDNAVYTSPIVSEVISYINLHYGEPLSLEELAEKFYVSKYYLSHEFSRHMETSIYRYLQKKRLLMARQMLAQGKKPNVVSVACGFGDYTSFYRAFRGEYGMAPRDFMQCHGSEQKKTALAPEKNR